MYCTVQCMAKVRLYHTMQKWGHIKGVLYGTAVLYSTLGGGSVLESEICSDPSPCQENLDPTETSIIYAEQKKLVWYA